MGTSWLDTKMLAGLPHASSMLTTSLISQRRFVTPAAIAGVVRERLTLLFAPPPACASPRRSSSRSTRKRGRPDPGGSSRSGRFAHRRPPGAQCLEAPGTWREAAERRLKPPRARLLARNFTPAARDRHRRGKERLTRQKDSPCSGPRREFSRELLADALPAPRASLTA